jgi:hypothetical protein
MNKKEVDDDVAQIRVIFTRLAELAEKGQDVDGYYWCPGCRRKTRLWTRLVGAGVRRCAFCLNVVTEVSKDADITEILATLMKDDDNDE